MATHREVLEVLAEYRRDFVVITTMGSVGIWPSISDTPLDFHYLPSSMGQGVPLGLGLALAKPGRGVIVITGDGSLLMNLGCLVTSAQFEVPLHIVLIDNGLYEVTGGQPVPGAGATDFGSIARGAGFEYAYGFDTLDGWKGGIEECLSQPGPVFIWLKVQGETGKSTPRAPRPMAEQIERLRGRWGETSARRSSLQRSEI